MLITAIKPEAEIVLFPPKLFPWPINFKIFGDAWTAKNFSLFLLNTLKIAFFNVIFVTISSSLVAFGFARMQFPGKNILFIILLATMMIPYEVQIIPLYIGYKYIGWLNTHLPLIVPSLFSTAYFVFFMRQYMMGIPIDLDEAATIDGCGPFQIWYRIILPLIKPVLASCIIFQFLWCWNDFFGPLIFLQTPDKWTFILGISALKGDRVYIPWNKMMAITTLFSIPPLIVFFLAQDKLIGGLATTGLKN